MSTLVAPPPRTFGPVSLTDIVRYQGASGDFFAIHHDERFARAAGFEQPISVGMLQAGILADWAVDWLGAAHVRMYRARFKEPVWPGDVLVCSGWVVRQFEEESEQRVEVGLTCTRQGNGVAIEARAVFAVAGLP